MIQQIEHATAKATLAQIRNGLRTALRVRSDPVGFGQYLHLHAASWYRLRSTWYRDLPRLTIAVEVADIMLRSEMSAGTTVVGLR